MASPKAFPGANNPLLNGTPVENALNAAYTEGENIGNVINAAERFGRAVADNAALDYVAGGGAEESAAVIDLGGSMMDVALLPLVLIAVGIAIVLRWLTTVVYDLIGHVPIAGRRLQALWAIATYPLNLMDTAIIDFAQLSVKGAVAAYVHIVQFVATSAYFASGGPLDPVISYYVRPVKQEVDHLWGWVTDINRWVQSIATTVGVEAHGGSPATGVLVEQVHTLQRDVATLNGRLDRADHAITGLDAELHTLVNAYNDLAARIGGVRAVNVGWQDVNTQLQTLHQTVQATQVQQGALINGVMIDVTHLLPLGILLDAGAVGLANLRTLEDQMCQCPRLPHLSDHLGTALSLMQFVKGD